MKHPGSFCLSPSGLVAHRQLKVALNSIRPPPAITTYCQWSFKYETTFSMYYPLFPLCGFGFFSKSDFCAIFFSHFFYSSDSFFKFNLSRLQINAKDACSESMSGLAASSTVCKKSFSGLSSGTLKKSSLWASRRLTHSQ